MRPIFQYYHDILSKDECEYLIEYSKDKLEPSKVDGGAAPKYSLRRSKVTWIGSDSEKECNDIVSKVVDMMFYESIATHSEEISEIERIQLSKYGLLDHYSNHIDLSYNGPYRILSGVVELSNPSDYIGGGLSVYIAGKKHNVPLKQGSVVFFPSILTHKAKTVFAGSRYSLALWGRKKVNIES